MLQPWYIDSQIRILLTQSIVCVLRSLFVPFALSARDIQLHMSLGNSRSVSAYFRPIGKRLLVFT